MATIPKHWPPRAEVPQANSKPIKAVVGPDSNPLIVGRFYLAWHTRSRRFYVGRSAPRYYFKRRGLADLEYYRRAIHEFIQYARERMEQAPEPVRVFPYTMRNGSAAFDWSIDFEAPIIGRIVGKWILDNPVRAAEKTGIPELAFLDKLQAPLPSLKVADLLDTHVALKAKSKSKPLSPDTIRNLTQYHKVFADAVQVRTLREITQEDIQRWAGVVWAEYEAGTGSPATVRNKIQALITILGHLARKNRDKAECERVLALIHELDLPEAPADNPQPISRDDFQALLDAADKHASPHYWRAVLLCSLNGLLKNTDVRIMRKADINWKTGVVCFRRNKTGVLRIFTLWPETREALKAYLEANPHNHEQVFIAASGKPHTQKSFGNSFIRFRDFAGVSVAHEQIRDGGYTEAITIATTEKIDTRLCKIVGAHKTDIADKYVLRNPRMVKPACEAIYKAYMDKPKSRKGGKSK